jgi:hypothetical protein
LKVKIKGWENHPFIFIGNKMIFADTNSVYIANIRLTFTQDKNAQLCAVLSDYLIFHWDFRVALLQASPSTIAECTLQVEMERGYTNMYDFRDYTANVFIPSLKARIEYVSRVLLRLPTIYWNKNFSFTINNREKLMGYNHSQVDQGGRLFYEPELPLKLNVAHYLDTGEVNGKF